MLRTSHGRHHAAIREVHARLAAAGVPSPDADARWLVDHVVEVVGDPGGCGAALLDGLVARRLQREPIQLITGRTWFRTVELACAAGVFVPRPETEIVAGVAIDAALAAGPDPRVLEPCTGTGAIACAIAAEVPGVTVEATDADVAAVELALTNLARVLIAANAPSGHAPGATGRVQLGDLLDPIDPAWRGTVDVLVANPPYLPASDRGSWDTEVADHDPDTALVGGPDGHEVVDEILELAPSWLRPGGTVVVEIDERRGPDALDTAARLGLLEARLVRDLTGVDRAVVARRAG